MWHILSFGGDRLKLKKAETKVFANLRWSAKNEKNVPAQSLPSAVSQLCPNCGLCCDSTLFADVELRKGDDPQRLASFGLALVQKTKTKLAFPQPCACFDGKLCGIYTDRPKRCRLFECGVLKRVGSGELTAGAALEKISRAKAMAEKVRQLLRDSGQREEHLPLTQRYSAAMSAPVDFSEEGAAERRGELMLAVSGLMQMLEAEFLR
jgi:Fe-S-cluster containining protein